MKLVRMYQNWRSSWWLGKYKGCTNLSSAQAGGLEELKANQPSLVPGNINLNVSYRRFQRLEEQRCDLEQMVLVG